ncbi:DUF4148 domain-containing protein [Rugamonas aquatica]|uniref:DUF4148 domain-containing protein n=1 Tax=Rugamonas aquatica TaxID=2743357 RepID=A0A6A7MZ56_9BURK|nr:DUF4148 domain-containing protein [Rugamonas aquatica]MQA37938.1 DUF4148 domain-containing protein [Rugamonas aquatica]
MSTTTKNLIRAAATAAFAIAATATTVTSAFAQSTAPAAATATAATTSAAQTAVANGALASTTKAQPAGLTRAQVQAEFLEARKNGTLIENEADMDVAQTKKHYAK